VEANWSKISASIRSVLDFVRGKTFIQCGRALPSYLVLIPLIYVRYHFPDAWKQATQVDTYLLRCLLTGAFGGNSDNLLDALTKHINEAELFDVNGMFSVIRSQGRSLEMTEDRLWQLGYQSQSIHLLFNMWYKQFNYTPAYENNMPQVDHVFPQSALRGVRILNPETNRSVMRYQERERNQLGNCMLLSKEENGAGGKWDRLPEDWFADKDGEYLSMHLIPEDRELWKLANFERFVEAREQLIREKFRDILLSPALSQVG
jgi:hypothetical protein